MYYALFGESILYQTLKYQWLIDICRSYNIYIIFDDIILINCCSRIYIFRHIVIIWKKSRLSRD